MRSKTLAFAAAVLLAGAINISGTNAESGFATIPVPANTDVVASVPFAKAALATFAVTTTTGTGITITGTLPVDGYATVFYIRMTSGSANGRWSTISSNTASTFELVDTSFLGSVAAADTFVVVPHQTLAKVFPPELLGYSYSASTSSTVHTFEVLLPDSAVGINKAPVETYYYRTVAGVAAWRKFGAAASANFDSTVLVPGSYFTLRNLNATPLTYLTSGETLTSRQQATGIKTEAVQNDIPVSTNNGVEVRLLDLNLGGTSAFLNSTSSTTHTDELLVFDNAATGFNKAPVKTYYYRQIGNNAAWRLFGDAAAADHSSDKIPAGAGILLRKGGGTPGSNDWVQPSH
jgi:uncharacterized protein (TIGR02597 family)